jgi:hypothetical protein
MKHRGRGLILLEFYILEVTKLMEYVDNKEDRLIQIVKTHQINTNLTTLHTAVNLWRIMERN